MELRWMGIGNESKTARINADTHRWLDLFKLGNKLTAGQQVHLALSMLRLRVDVARASGQVPPGITGDTFELGLILLLADLGLLLPAEAARAMAMAHELRGEDVQTRLRALCGLATERLRLLEPEWEQRRAVLARMNPDWTPNHALAADKTAALWN